MNKPSDRTEYAAAEGPDPSGEPAEAGEEPISRGQRKREAVEITKLGQTISELSDSELENIPLDDRALSAVLELRRIRSFAAKKRQLHYLGKVLRQTDLEPIRAALEVIQRSAAASKQRFHAIEGWRDRLLTEGDKALQEYIRQFPSTNRQQLRQLIRNHAKLQRSPHPTSRPSRELFKLIRGDLDHASKH